MNVKNRSGRTANRDPIVAPREQLLETPRLRFAWTEFPGRLPSIVFIHPNRTSPRVWDHVIDASTRPERMVTPALRGHGGSAWPNAGYTLEDHRDDLIAFIDASCEGPVILCGQATGATLALMIATQLGSQRVRAVIAAQPAVAIPSAINDLVQTQVIAQERLASRSAARAALPFASLWSEAVTEHYLEHMLLETAEGGFRWRYHAEGVRATEAQLLRPLDREIAWSGPTLIIGSTESTVLSPESIRALASRLPDARLEWLPRSNHRLCQDNPEGFARLLDDYLSLQLA